MKKTYVILAGLAVFAILAFTVKDSNDKVKVNHKGRIIEVASSAVEAHLAHGDNIVGGSGSSSAALH